VLQCVAVCCQLLRDHEIANVVAVWCSVLQVQRVAVCCRYRALQCVSGTARCSVLQLQCVASAMCCSALQCVAKRCATMRLPR